MSSTAPATPLPATPAPSLFGATPTAPAGVVGATTPAATSAATGAGAGAGAVAPPVATAGANPANTAAGGSTSATSLTVVPSFEEAFPLHSIWSRLRGHVDAAGSLDAQTTEGRRLVQFLLRGTVQVHDHTATTATATATATNKNSSKATQVKDLLNLPHLYHSPDTQPPSPSEKSLQESLRANPRILLHAQETLVSPAIYEECRKLTQELGLPSMLHGLALYAEASNVKTRHWLCRRLGEENNYNNKKNMGAAAAAGRGPYFVKLGKDKPTSFSTLHNNKNKQEKDEGQVGEEHTAMQTEQPSSSTQNTKDEEEQVTYHHPDNEEYVPLYARELYLYEVSCQLRSLRMLVLKRMAATSDLWRKDSDTGSTPGGARQTQTTMRGVPSAVHVATDHFLRAAPAPATQEGLLSNLLEIILQLTKQINTLITQQEHLRQKATTMATPPPHHVPPTFESSSSKLDAEARTTMVQLQAFKRFYVDQRQAAAQCLFHLLYHTQATTKEVGRLLDVIRHLTNGSTAVGTRQQEEKEDDDGLRPLDVLADVPSVLCQKTASMTHAHAHPSHYPHHHASSSSSSPQFKSKQEWKEELVSTHATAFSRRCKPQLAKVVNTLLMAALCAMDGQHVFLDREVHGPNRFGMGNAIVPPPETGLPPAADLALLHDRMVDPEHGPRSSPSSSSSFSSGTSSTNCSSLWSRKDIWGLLSSSYALLLRPVAIRFEENGGGGGGGSRSGSGSGSGNPYATPGREGGTTAEEKAYVGTLFGIFGAFRSCLTAAASCKSLTYARTSMVPSWGGAVSVTRPNESDDAAEEEEDGNAAEEALFYVTVLAGFVSKYFRTLVECGEVPISRRMWLEESEGELELRKLQRDQRRQFSLQLGQLQQQEEGGEDDAAFHVDLAKRPDCMDDVVALVVAICTACPPCSNLFWDFSMAQPVGEAMQVAVREGGEEKKSDEWRMVLQPSVAVMELDSLVTTDSSLFSSYLSLLSVLALSESVCEEEEAMQKENTQGTSASTTLSPSNESYLLDPSTRPSESIGAVAVHAMLSHDEGDVTISPPVPAAFAAKVAVPPSSLSWPYLLGALQWYADELWKSFVVGRSSSNSTSSSRAGVSSAVEQAASGGDASWEVEYSSSYYDYGEGVSSTSSSWGGNSSRGAGGTYDSVQGRAGLAHGQQASNASQQQQRQSSQQQQKQQQTTQEAHNILSEEHTIALLSLLNLIQRVAARSTLARRSILNTRVTRSLAGEATANYATSYTTDGVGISTPSTNAGNGRDVSILAVLFALAASLPPSGILPMKIKGTTYETIAVLVHGCSSACIDSWDWLEVSQVLPTVALSQYASPIHPPPRSASAAAAAIQRSPFSGRSGANSSVGLGIIYEMEHVEAQAGVYPATEGFLSLLSSLIRTVGCPPHLGSAWRRPGVAPYVEYIVSYVLPRIIPSSSEKSTADVGRSGILKFDAPSDRYRLVSRALDVLASVIVRYPVPPASPTKARSSGGAVVHFPNKSSNSQAELTRTQYLAAVSSAKELGLYPSLGIFGGRSFEDFSMSQFSVVDWEDAAKDFRDEWVNMPLHSSSSAMTMGTGLVSSKPTVPRAKNPGFSLLVEILSGQLFLKELLLLLVDDGGANGIEFFADESNTQLLIYSLFDAEPDYALAKENALKILNERSQSHGSRYYGSSTTPQHSQWRQPQTDILMNMLVKHMRSSFQLTPPALHPVFDLSDFDKDKPALVLTNDYASWRERCAASAMQIICACAARESQFMRSLHASPTALTIVPVMQLANRNSSIVPGGGAGGGGLEVKDVGSLYRLSDVLHAAAAAAPFSEGADLEPLPCTADYVGYKSLRPETVSGEGLAKMAVAIISYVSKTLPSHVALKAVCGRFSSGHKIADSFGRRLLMPSVSTSSFYAAFQVLMSSSMALTLPDSPNESILSALSEEKADGDVRDTILKLLLNHLSLPSPNLSSVLLGLNTSTTPYFTHQSLQISQKSSINCLRSILYLLQDKTFVLEPRTAPLATSCFELLYRLCSASAMNADTNAGGDSSNVWAILRAENFWFRQYQTFFCSTNDGSSASRVPGLSSKNPSLFELLCSGEQCGEKGWADILHSLSWLLKGVAIELGGRAFERDCGVHHKDGLVEHILSYFVQMNGGDGASTVLRILRILPLRAPGGKASLRVTRLRNPPHWSLVQSAVCELPGPVDVFRGFKGIDMVSLLTSANAAKVQNPSIGKALSWAQEWNVHVSSVCASTHLASAWSALTGASILCLESVTMKDSLQANKASILSVVNAILLRLTTHEEGLNVPSSTVKHVIEFSLGKSDGEDVSSHQVSNDDLLEASSAVPLCATVLRLCQYLVAHKEVSDKLSATSPQGATDVALTCALLAKSITACSVCDAHHERAAILCCALVQLLRAVGDGNGLYLGRIDEVKMESFIHAAVYLSSLSASNRLGSHDKRSHGGKKNDSIAFAARACLCSLLSTFDDIASEVRLPEQTRDQVKSQRADNFLSEVFKGTDGEERLSVLVRLLTLSDVDVAWTLVRIASCRGGTEFLMHSGVSAALLEAVGDGSENETMNDSDLGLYRSQRENSSYGAVVNKLPVGLLAHLKLFSTMLSACPRNVRLGMECAGFLRHHGPTAEELLSAFPREGDTTSSLLLTLSLAASTISADDKRTDSWDPYTQPQKSIGAVLGRQLPRIERAVIDFALHVASFPFPHNVMPPLPPWLLEAEESQLQMQRKVALQPGRSWWDSLSAVKDSSDYDCTALTQPRSFLSPETDYMATDDDWTERHYSYAILAADSLESALRFLKERASSAGVVTLALDRVALAKAIYRCSFLSMLIEGYLSELSTSVDQTIESATKLDPLEKKRLLSLGARLGRSTESLLVLTSLHIRCLSRDLALTGGAAGLNSTRKDTLETAKLLTKVLDATDIERTGVGCVGAIDENNSGKDFAMKIARSLREQLASL